MSGPEDIQEPTLRFGDDNPDGWVEYLQDLLTSWSHAYGGGDVTRNGEFDVPTRDAVVWFQQTQSLLVDGVVGNQTWAALRNEEPQAIGTDGRAPGTYVEEGPEARWFSQDADSWYHEPARDLLLLYASNTGSDNLSRNNVELQSIVLTTQSGRDVPVERVYFFDEDGQVEAEPGEMFAIAIADARQLVGADEEEDVDVDVRAVMGQSLGGDVLEVTATLTR